MGVAPIPVSEILDFAETVGISEIEDYLFIIQAMDNAYLDEHNMKQARENPKKK